MSLANGTRLGPYEIFGPLGAGGMGEVYKAEDTRLGREVAVKVLPAEFAADPERLRRFEQEARATAALDHPNILAIHDIGTHEGNPYIVEQLLEGESLRQRLRTGPLPPAKAVEFGVQIAQGLAAAHEKGIVHRDLKPENLWLTKDGRIKILDFGLARLRPQGPMEQEPQTEAPTADSPTREGTVLGTVGYMSPEQARGQPADARSDIFSFGAVLYEMLSGKKAFSRDSTVDTLSAILHEDPPELDRLSSSLSLPLVQLLRRCLEKKPEDRFSSTNDLAFALQTVASSGDILATRPGAALASARRWTRRHRAAAVGLCTLLSAAILAGFLLWRPWRRATAPVAPPAAVLPSLVALPCKVLGSPESAYLTDAIPSTISTLLGEVQGMDTKVPPTSFEVEKVQGDLDKITKAYGVQTFVLSTATAEGDHLVFNIQLADARTRKVRWSHQYQGSKANYTAMAREAAQGICKAVLPEAVAVGLAPGISSNSESELAFQQGKYYASRHFNHLARADFDRALEAFQRAFQLDPKSTAASAGIAGLYGVAGEQGYMPLIQAKVAREVWLQKAMDLDPRAGEVWKLRADLEAWKPDADLEKEIEYSLKAAQLTPRDPDAQRGFATMGIGTGGSAALGIDCMREGLRLDPLFFQGYSVLATMFAELGRTEEALQALDTQFSLDPDNLWGLLTKVYVLVEAGRIKEASALQERLEAGGSYGPVRNQFVTNGRWLISLADGDEREARTCLRVIMNHFTDPATIWNWLQWDIIFLLPAVNRRFGKDAALDLLILSTKRGATYPYDALMLRPDLKGLREDPRAKDVIARRKTPFDLLIRILQGARSRGECPKYIEKPMDDLLKDLQSRGAWP